MPSDGVHHNLPDFSEFPDNTDNDIWIEVLPDKSPCRVLLDGHQVGPWFDRPREAKKLAKELVKQYNVNNVYMRREDNFWWLDNETMRKKKGSPGQEDD